MKQYSPLAAYLLIFCLLPVFTFSHAAFARENNSEIQSEFEDPFADPFADEEKEQEKDQLPDPLEPYNRAVFKLNDFFYLYIMKPASTGYRFVTTRGIRKSVGNFFSNLSEPVYFANSILQGEGSDAHTAFARFTVNSTFGLAGLFDVVGTEPEQAPRSFNQTLARWGTGPGFYIVWPVAGGTSLRGTAGMTADKFLNPAAYTDSETSIYATSLENLNGVHSYLQQYRDLKRYNLDPYISLKKYHESREIKLPEK